VLARLPPALEQRVEPLYLLRPERPAPALPAARAARAARAGHRLPNAHVAPCQALPPPRAPAAVSSRPERPNPARPGPGRTVRTASSWGRVASAASTPSLCAILDRSGSSRAATAASSSSSALHVPHASALRSYLPRRAPTLSRAAPRPGAPTARRRGEPAGRRGNRPSKERVGECGRGALAVLRLEQRHHLRRGCEPRLRLTRQLAEKVTERRQLP